MYGCGWENPNDVFFGFWSRLSTAFSNKTWFAVLCRCVCASRNVSAFWEKTLRACFSYVYVSGVTRNSGAPGQNIPLLSFPYLSPPIPFKRLPPEIFMLVHELSCSGLSGTRGPLQSGAPWTLSTLPTLLLRRWSTLLLATSVVWQCSDCCLLNGCESEGAATLE